MLAVRALKEAKNPEKYSNFGHFCQVILQCHIKYLAIGKLKFNCCYRTDVSGFKPSTLAGKRIIVAVRKV